VVLCIDSNVFHVSSVVEQKERFSSLRKWFYKVIVKPKEQQQQSSASTSTSSFKSDIDVRHMIDKEYAEDIAKLERNKDNDEARLNETLKDWMSHTKLSVAVTGPTGVGKSLLINTLLETTFVEKKDTDDTPPPPSKMDRSDNFTSSYEQQKNLSLNNVHDSISNTLSSNNGTIDADSKRKSVSSMAAAAEDNDDLDWVQCASWRSSSSKRKTKQYRRETAYTFEGTTEQPHEENEMPSVSPQSHNNSATSQLITSLLKKYSGESITDIYKDLRDSEGLYARHHRQQQQQQQQSQRDGSLVHSDATGPPLASVDATDSFQMESDVILLDDYAATKPQNSCYKRSTAYIFNLPSNTPEVSAYSHLRDTFTQHKDSEFDVMDIYKNYELNEEFLKTVDWEKERQERPALNGWRSIRPFAPDDERPFLLPQGHFAAPSVLLRYGKIPEAIVCFPKEGELRLALWELHEIARGTKSPASPEHFNLLQRRYRRLLGLSESTPIPLQHISTPHDFVLPPDVQSVVGKNFRFSGRGYDPEEDRIYIREKIREVSRQFGLFMCRLMVRIPCGILEGNKELVEISGIYSSDLTTKLTLQNANLVMVAVNRTRGITGDLIALLKQSGLVEKLLADPEQHTAIFLELEETSKIMLPHEMFTKEATEQFVQFKEQILRQWQQILQQSAAGNVQPGGDSASLPPTSSLSLLASSASRSPSAFVHAILHNSQALGKFVREHTNVVPVKPLLFAALHLRSGFPLEMLKGISLREA
jgi:GTPase SAR1 family protein